jgi:chromate transporter
VILPDNALDSFALVSAIVSLELLQSFHLPIHFLVSLGAVSGVIWRIVLQS